MNAVCNCRMCREGRARALGEVKAPDAGKGIAKVVAPAVVKDVKSGKLPKAAVKRTVAMGGPGSGPHAGAGKSKPAAPATPSRFSHLPPGAPLPHDATPAERYAHQTKSNAAMQQAGRISGKGVAPAGGKFSDHHVMVKSAGEPGVYYAKSTHGSLEEAMQEASKHKGSFVQAPGGKRHDVKMGGAWNHGPVGSPTRGPNAAAADAHTAAAKAHMTAASAKSSGHGNANTLAAEARQASMRAEQASLAARNQPAAARAGTARDAGRTGAHSAAAGIHSQVASMHRQATGMKSAETPVRVSKTKPINPNKIRPPEGSAPAPGKTIGAIVKAPGGPQAPAAAAGAPGGPAMKERRLGGAWNHGPVSGAHASRPDGQGRHDVVNTATGEKVATGYKDKARADAHADRLNKAGTGPHGGSGAPDVKAPKGVTVDYHPDEGHYSVRGPKGMMIVQRGNLGHAMQAVRTGPARRPPHTGEA